MYQRPHRAQALGEEPEPVAVLRIAVPSPIRDCLDYLPPEAGPAAPSPGVRVRVPLGRRSVVGVVVAHAGHSTLPRERLRPVTAVLDRTPVLPADLLALAAWMTDYYQHPPGEVLALFLPPTVRRGETTAEEALSLVMA